MADDVYAQVAQCLKGAPTLFLLTAKDTESEDKEITHHCKRKPLKAGKICTTDLCITKQVKWPHEMVYTGQGKPPSTLT